MLKAAKAKTAWSMQLDLRQVGLGIGWTLLAVSLLMIVALYALTLSNPEWKPTPALNLTSAVAIGLFISSVLILALTYAVKAVADSIDSYQAAVQDIVSQLSKAIPPAEPEARAGVYDIRDARGKRQVQHTMN